MYITESQFTIATDIHQFQMLFKFPTQVVGINDTPLPELCANFTRDQTIQSSYSMCLFSPFDRRSMTRTNDIMLFHLPVHS